MRSSSESWLIVALGAFALTGWVALQLGRRHEAIQGDPLAPVFVTQPDPAPVDAATWFGGVRQHCNPVEVETRMRSQPPPPTPEGRMYEAACYALAGRTDRAREVINGLPEAQRYLAAGVVFEAGHPAADAGDDVAAGPLMELVVEFWPNHYMALYHSGAARYEGGDHARAKDYLTRFLAEYATEDERPPDARGDRPPLAPGVPQLGRAHAHPGPHPGSVDCEAAPGVGTGVLRRRSMGASGGVSPSPRPAAIATSPHVSRRSCIPCRTSTVRPFAGQRYS